MQQMSPHAGAGPFYTLEFLEDFLVGHQAIIGAAKSPRRLRELLNAHRDVKPFQDVFGMRM
jgi:hypothetical protein